MPSTSLPLAPFLTIFFGATLAPVEDGSPFHSDLKFVATFLGSRFQNCSTSGSAGGYFHLREVVSASLLICGLRALRSFLPVLLIFQPIFSHCLLNFSAEFLSCLK